MFCSIGTLPSNGGQIMKALLKENGFNLTEVNNEKISMDLDQSCHSKICRKR